MGAGSFALKTKKTYQLKAVFIYLIKNSEVERFTFTFYFVWIFKSNHIRGTRKFNNKTC